MKIRISVAGYSVVVDKTEDCVYSLLAKRIQQGFTYDLELGQYILMQHGKIVTAKNIIFNGTETITMQPITKLEVEVEHDVPRTS